MKKPKFESPVCDCCNQTTQWDTGLGKGDALTMLAIAKKIEIKGINCVHPSKEMVVANNDWTKERCLREGVITATMRGNITTARGHGLIAQVKGNSGNYKLTAKGESFLNGAPVPRWAIMSKVEKRLLGYLQDDQGHAPTITIGELMEEDKMWVAINFQIYEGRVVTKAEDIKTMQHRML